MSNNSRRVRCLICNNLVFPDFSVNVPSAVVFKTINKKHGCICTDCIESMYSTFNMLVDKYYGGGQKRGSLFDYMKPIPFSCEPTPSFIGDAIYDALSKLQPLKITLMQSTQSKPKTSVMSLDKANPLQKINKNSTISISEKYSCLDCSLDSYAEIVKKRVIGQDQAVTALLFVLYYNQMANLIEEHDGRFVKRNHIMLIGNTGVGKTFLATNVCEVFNIPYALFNATSITSAGYIGDKVENILDRLYEKANGNLELAENGIVIIDEIDKKRVSPDNGGKDVTGRSVQQELLKILEPSEIYLKNHDITFHTNNITVIMAGAFVELDEIVKKRNKRGIIGFTTEPMKDKDTDVTQQDLINYGFIPEFVGRVPTVIKLNDLTKETIIDIIYNHLSMYSVFFELKNISFVFDELYIRSLADYVMNSPTGARDIDTILFSVLKPALYRIFQSPAGGSCEINDKGETELLVSNKNGSTMLYNFDCVKHYEPTDEDECESES